jgi:hypothetical protein
MNSARNPSSIAAPGIITLEGFLAPLGMTAVLIFPQHVKASLTSADLDAAEVLDFELQHNLRRAARKRGWLLLISMPPALPPLVRTNSSTTNHARAVHFVAIPSIH